MKYAAMLNASCPVQVQLPRCVLIIMLIMPPQCTLVHTCYNYCGTLHMPLFWFHFAKA